jgi:hypothetical protein
MPELKFAPLFFISFFIQNTSAQPHISHSQTDSVTRAVHPQFQVSGLSRFIFGSLWREAWTTPVNVEILNLDSSQGGFTFDSVVMRTHQGTMTRSFLYKDKEGNANTFTPIDQDSASSLPQELSVLLPRKIVEDQLSTLNPFAPLVVVPLLQAAGLPYRESRLVFLPDDAQVLKDSLQHERGLGLLEGPWRTSFTNVKPLQSNLFETSSMLESLENNLHNKIDELQYLKSRLIDILLGDWDRSADQWQWLKVQTSTNIMWEPVPLMHRQAFVRLDGLLPTIADYAIPELEQCGGNISSIENTTLTGRSLDRRVLLSYSKQTWDSLAHWLQIQVTDSVIQRAISLFPPPIHEKEGKSLAQLLQARRAQLPKVASEFYKLCSAYVEIFGSKNADRAEIRRVGRHMVSVTLSDRFDTSHSPLYQRLFHDDVTKEIRLLLLDGDDQAIIDGEKIGTMKIIVDGGSGNNELTDISKSRSVFSDLNLFSYSGADFYNTNLTRRTPPGSTVHMIRDWGSEWSFTPWFDMNPDDGMFIGGGPVNTQFSYRSEPFTEQIGMRAGLATKTGRYRFDATGDFRNWFHGVSTFIQLHASQLDFSNFFGLGNETPYNASRVNAGFYKVDQRQIFLHAAIHFPVVLNTSVSFGSTLKLIENNPKPGTLLDTLRLAYYNKSLTFINVTLRFLTDTRDNGTFPTQGFYFDGEGSYLPQVFDNANTYYKFRSEIRTYVSPDDFRSITIAVRAAGEKIWGIHPFFESAFLGGTESLRGYERQRFAGDASLLGGMELRARIAQIPFLVPLWMGISGFAETGRVFIDDEPSQRWHHTLGGGMWFSILKPEYLVSVSLARSEDEFAFYTTLGFTF